MEREMEQLQGEQQTCAIALQHEEYLCGIGESPHLNRTLNHGSGCRLFRRERDRNGDQEVPRNGPELQDGTFPPGDARIHSARGA